MTPEGKGAFAGFIGPRTLVANVEVAQPFLFDGRHPRAGEVPATSGERLDEQARGPLGWWSVLRHAELCRATPIPTPAQRTEYFALCLAAHFASVASYVPTDVDAKIRHALWFEPQPPEELERMAALALGLARWDVSPVSARLVPVAGFGTLSGHDGERLAVLAGGLLGLTAAGDAPRAAAFAEAIDAELGREAAAFDAAVSGGPPLDVLRLAAVLTHNAGDLDQGLAARSGRAHAAPWVERFGDLARSGRARYGGAFARAAAIYRVCLAREGHRNYPLRATKLLRRDPALMLPIAPFLDGWGELLATYPAWNDPQRAEVVSALVAGCAKVPGQEAYFRALAGLERAHPGGLAAPALAEHYPSAVRRALKDSDLRRKLALRRESFESSLVKEARRVLAAGAG